MKKKYNYKMTGLEEIMANLNKEVNKIEGKTMIGLIKAAALIRRTMETEEPKVPVDTGNLRASWFVDTFITKNNPTVIMGFQANYAIFVHENVNANFAGKPKHKNKKYHRRKGAGAKFLEYAIKRKQKEILGLIKENTML